MPEPDEMAEFLVDDAPPTNQAAPEPEWRNKVRNSRFGQTAVIIVAIFAVLIAAWWVVKPSQKTDSQAETAAITQVDVAGVQQAPKVGDKAPGFTATDISGQQIELASLQGKPTWLIFMATWCAGCRTEMPDVQAAIAEHGDELNLVTIYVGEATSKVQAYSERVGNDFPQIADSAQSISAAYGIMGVPSHYFLDAQGVVQQTHVGLLSPTMMADSISSLLGG